MRHVEPFQLITKGICHFADILFVTDHHQSVAQLKNHIRSRQKVNTGTADASDGCMVLLTEIEGSDSFSITLRPRHSYPSGYQVVRFLGLHMQVIILHFA